MGLRVFYSNLQDSNDNVNRKKVYQIKYYNIFMIFCYSYFANNGKEQIEFGWI